MAHERTPIDRRSLLKRGALLGGVAAFGGALLPELPAAATTRRAPRRLAAQSDSILNHPAVEAPVDTVVVLMMENRSVDHHLGWLAADPTYIEEGRRRYGHRFRFDADSTQTFAGPDGRRVDTWYLPGSPGERNPYRRCDHPDPGHGWDSGRAQRDGGFLADGSRNDEFALGYYAADDVPVYADLVRRFTTFDRYHCSLLSSTYPNRAYLHSAQSGGRKNNDLPTGELGYQWPTIWDRLLAAGVPAAYYHVDLPVTALWGPRLVPHTRPMAEYFALCQAGALPRVVFLDPGFTTDLQTDDHPGGSDTRAAQKFVADVFWAFARSKHWQRGAFFVTYDEWGGFFDHVAPPILPDDRASSDDNENFGQAGFRVPTILASPHARRGFVDHTLYDHTSILRFIEWRFLGAPPTGPQGDGWFLTARDRNANNIGSSLVTAADPDVAVEVLPPPPVASLSCDDPLNTAAAAAPMKHPFEQAYESGYFDRVGYRLNLGSALDLTTVGL
jgi:phospholipase C